MGTTDPIFTDKAVRDGAVRNLRAFLSRGETDGGESSTFTRINDAEMAKLWKGLFYCTFRAFHGIRAQRRGGRMLVLIMVQVFGCLINH